MTQKKEMVNVLVISQFIKDLSFENFRTANHNLSMRDLEYKVDINVAVENEASSRSQVILNLLCEATDKVGKVYILEIQYGGEFEISSCTKKEKRRVLQVECPDLLFPFIRRLAYDITKEGGSYPLNLNPVKFSNIQ